MTISILLIVYFVFMGLGVLYALVNLYHIFSNGHFDAKSYFVTGIFMAGFILILFVSSVYMIQIDWSAGLGNLNGGGNFNTPSSQF